MRKVTVVALFLSMMIVSTGSASAQGIKRVFEMKVNSFYDDGNYRITVSDHDDGKTWLDIVYEGPAKRERLIRFDATGMYLLYAKPGGGGGGEYVALVWEAGTGGQTTVFRLAPTAKGTELVFDENGEGTEFSDAGSQDVMVFYTGRQYFAHERHEGSRVPETATLYVWNGKEFQRTVSVPYEKRFEALNKMSLVERDIAPVKPAPGGVPKHNGDNQRLGRGCLFASTLFRLPTSPLPRFSSRRVDGSGRASPRSMRARVRRGSARRVCRWR